MFEKKIPLVLTSAAVAASLFLATADGNAAERPRRQTEELRRVEVVRELQLWELLPRFWQKAISQRNWEALAGKGRSSMDPEGLTQKGRSSMDPEG